MDESRVSKRNGQDVESECDRLSELPDSLILVILSLLEMEDVVRTTILSKRWKDLWTTVPCLRFCGDPSFIDAALSKWNGDKILNFSLRFYERSCDFRDSWLLLPIQKRVENLFFRVKPYLYPNYCPPQPLYSCSSITKLSLYFCELKIEETVQWNQLKSLELVGIDQLSERAMNLILSGAPVLEKLKLLALEISEDLNIRSTSLKMLNINTREAYVVNFEENSNSPVFEIWAPNLESLEISGIWYRRSLLNVPSLTNARLGLEDRYSNTLGAHARYIMREEMFRSLSHVQKLTVTNPWSVKFLVDEMKKENFVVFPKLEMLIFEQNEWSYDRSNYSLAPNTIFPRLSLSLLQLKTVVITWDLQDASIFAVVQILLEHARALEKMVIRLRMCKAYPEEYILALEKVVSMRRASPSVKVIISKIG